MKLSIIIPMYNAEKYIADCLDSILKSDLPKGEYEVIIVNDGSKDKGPEIAQDYVSKHENFRYLTQENQGQSVARNYGIEEAQGEYIWCVDSDDKTDNKVLTDILHELNTHSELDILAFQLKQITESGDFISYECTQQSVKHNTVMKGREAILSGYMPSSVCALAIRKRLLMDNKLSFKKGITQQDVELSYQLFAYADNVYFSEHRPYLYIHHENSTSKSTDPKKRIKYESDKAEIIMSFRKLALSFEKTDPELSQGIRKYSDGALFGCVYNLYKNRKVWKSLGVNKAVIQKLKDSQLYPLKGPFDSWKKKLAAMFLNREWLIA